MVLQGSTPPSSTMIPVLASMKYIALFARVLYACPLLFARARFGVDSAHGGNFRVALVPPYGIYGRESQIAGPSIAILRGSMAFPHLAD